MRKKTEKEITQLLQDSEYVVKESRAIFHTFHHEIVGIIDTLETQECISSDTASMLRNRIFTLKIQSDKLEEQYYKLKNKKEE